MQPARGLSVAVVECRDELDEHVLGLGFYGAEFFDGDIERD